MSKLLAAMIALALSGTQPTYRIDPASSNVVAKVGFMGVASKTAGFPAMSGSIRIDPEDTASIDLRVDLDARELTAPDKTTLKRLKGEKFFWVERYPTVSFRGDTLLMETDRKGRVEGRMTARGVTRPVMLDVTFDRPLEQIGGNRPIVIEAETTIDRRDFGMKSYSMVVGKSVDIRIRARLVPQSG
ncbi:YceI family protein [Sphingomicrobium flavum]|uniref:YceI family protein n=1 Tax=Sphingomicrobium flavum TaxID=1229164 RepID=UPI0021AD614F|nr:YceI family protein [Sphingomicrobium flavum]